MSEAIEPSRSQPFVQVLFDRLVSSANVKTVYGEPITAHGKTIIPVARVAFGFGMGMGTAQLKVSAETRPGGDAGGGGGGVAVRPVGVVEVTPASTRFIRYRRAPIIAMAAGLGLLAGLLVGKRSRR